MALDFTAIDFETANSSPASACAVGMVRVRDARVVARAGWLIKPPPGHDRFQPVNIGIHGIRPEHVADAAAWEDQLDELAAFAGADVLAAHNAGFDMGVLRRACEATSQPCPPYRYICSVQIARRTYDLDSYRLPRAAAAAGFTSLSHHDPISDAEACAHIVIDAARRADLTDITALASITGVRMGRTALADAAAA